MSSCCVIGCQNRRTNGFNLKFYRIPAATPSKNQRRQLWLNAIRRSDWTEAIIKNARVCSAHFISGEASMDKDNPDYVPSVFPCERQSGRQRGRSAGKLARLERQIKTEDETEEEDTLCHADDPVTPEEPEEEEEESKGTVPQIVYDSLSLKYDQLSAEHDDLKRDFYKLKEENALLKEELQKSRFSGITDRRPLYLTNQNRVCNKAV